MSKKAPLRQDLVPAEPFRRIIREAVERASGEHFSANNDLKLTALYRVAVQIWESDLQTSHDALRRFLNATRSTSGSGEWVTFDLADRILCKLDLGHLWQSDPVFSEIYDKVNLGAIDAMYPVCDETAADARAIFDETHNVKKTAMLLGVGPGTVKKLVQVAV